MKKYDPNQWTKYFLAWYDCKTDELLGTFNTLKEAIRKVYGYDTNHPKYRNAQCAIIACYSQKNKSPGSKRRTARGIWYKIKK